MHSFVAPRIVSTALFFALVLPRPNGVIAQGSIFNVFGSSMGPSSLAYASNLPLPTTLGGTRVSAEVLTAFSQQITKTATFQ